VPLFTEVPRRGVLRNWQLPIFEISETEGMYVYLALNKSGSGAYHRYKSTLVPFSENLLWGDGWGKGKEELGTRLITCGNLPPLQVGKELMVHKSRMRDAVLSGRAELKGRIESGSERDRRLLSEIQAEFPCLASTTCNAAALRKLLTARRKTAPWLRLEEESLGQ